MSLIYLKNDDASVVEGGSSGHMSASRWSNYFTQPLKIAPNSQVAYVSSTFTMTGDASIQGLPYVMLIGTPELNPSINIWLKKQDISQFGDTTYGINEIGHLCNEYYVDGDYNNITTNLNTFTYGSVLQGREFQTGFNMLLKSDDKVDLRVVQRGVNDVFMQGFNPCATNGSFTYTGAYSSPAGINVGTGTNAIDSSYLGDVVFDATGGSSPSGIQLAFPNECIQPKTDSMGTARAPTNNFYNTGWASQKCSNAGVVNQAGALFNWGSTSATLNDYRHFNQNAYAMISTRVGIKKNISMGGAPTDNGGGHASIASTGSGGYAMITFGNQVQTTANTHYDAGYASPADVGFCGIAQQSFGVHSVDYINKVNAPWDGTGANSRKEFLINNDLNASPVAGSGNPTNALYAKARYIFGVDLIETEAGGGGGGSLEAHVRWLSSKNGTLDRSYYSSPASVGGNGAFSGILDIKELARGINTAVNPPLVYDPTLAAAPYQINTSGATKPASLIFRFRWTSPYTMCCEFTLSIRGLATSYNLETDEPHLPATTPNDPRTGWCMLYDLLQPNTGDFNSTYIPSFLGDIGMVAYPSVIFNNQVFMKGYFDTRRSSQADERIAVNTFGSELNSSLSNQQFYSPFSFGDLTLYQKNSNDPTQNEPPFMETCTPELFASDGTSTKEIKMILNELNSTDDVNAFSSILGAPMYLQDAPDGLDLGNQTGLITTKGGLDVNSDIAGTGTDFVEYGWNGVGFLDTGTNISSLHFQLRNLPIQSQQAVKSTMNKTIYVVNSLNASNSLLEGQHKRYSDRATELLWIDLNNLSGQELNKLDILITNDDNKEQTRLYDATDLVIMIRAKPKSAEGYVPNNIPVMNTY